MRRWAIGGWLLVFGWVAFAAEAQPAAGPRTGEAPPALSIAKWIQGPGKTPVTWESFRGKAVVLEFWAPWCGPCLGAIPHLNDLANQFKGKPVIFLAVTNDREDKVLKVLAKKPMSAWVGLDKEDMTFKAFGIRGIPQTVLVFPSGKIAAVANPYYVSKEALSSVLAGREPKLERPVTAQLEVGREPGDTKPAPLFEILIRPMDGNEEGATNGMGDNSFLSHNLNIGNAIGLAYDIPETRIVTDLPILKGKFTVVVRLPEGKGALMKPLLRQALETSFGFDAHKEKREMDAFVLTAPSGQGGLKSSDLEHATTRGGKGRSLASGARMDALCLRLERELKAPVLDDTGLKGAYDWDLSWDEDNTESILPAVKSELGLELKPAKRSVEVLVLELAPKLETRP